MFALLIIPSAFATEPFPPQAPVTNQTELQQHTQPSLPTVATPGSSTQKKSHKHHKNQEAVQKQGSAAPAVLVTAPPENTVVPIPASHDPTVEAFDSHPSPTEWRHKSPFDGHVSKISLTTEGLLAASCMPRILDLMNKYHSDYRDPKHEKQKSLTFCVVNNYAALINWGSTFFGIGSTAYCALSKTIDNSEYGPYVSGALGILTFFGKQYLNSFVESMKRLKAERRKIDAELASFIKQFSPENQQALIKFLDDEFRYGPEFASKLLEVYRLYNYVSAQSVFAGYLGEQKPSESARLPEF